jgi:hypothetical protein
MKAMHAAGRGQAHKQRLRRKPILGRRMQINRDLAGTAANNAQKDVYLRTSVTSRLQRALVTLRK